MVKAFGLFGTAVIARMLQLPKVPVGYSFWADLFLLNCILNCSLALRISEPDNIASADSGLNCAVGLGCSARCPV